MDWAALREELRDEAARLGWAACGVTGIEPFAEARLRGLDAVSAGRMAGMSWFTSRRVEASSDLAARHPWARCLVSLAWPYRPVRPAAPSSRPRGRMAAYACLDDGGVTTDYHELLRDRCAELLDWLRRRCGDVRAKRFVDHGWAMDRAVAQRAGIGFAGKHTSLLTTAAGSYVLLAEMALSLPLPPDPPSRRACGSCSACLPSCPTGAILAPGVIDARRCISYLTIEHRGPIPRGLRPLMGTWVFGCDLCQEACPINHRKAPPPLLDPGPSTGRGPVPAPDLEELLRLDEGAFEARFGGTAVARTGRAGLARNAAIALGNSAVPSALPALREAASSDPDEVVREAAGWAAQRIQSQRRSQRLAQHPHGCG